MSNLELIMNPYISPVYISTTNMLTPIATITFNKIYTIALVYGNLILNALQIFIQTAGFIMKEVVYILIIYNLFMMAAIDNQQRKIIEQNKENESLKTEINYLKKSERMREDLDVLWFQDVKKYHEETSNKIATLEKKIKKMDKEIRIYE